MPKLLIPVDGSEHALQAVRYAIHLADQFREPPDVLLVNVQSTIPLLDRAMDGRPSHVHALEQPAREHGARALAAAETALQKAKIPYQARVEIGDPAPIIGRLAKTYHCDFIVMGTRGLGIIRNLILGSVANKVLHVATVPVLLVK